MSAKQHSKFHVLASVGGAIFAFAAVIAFALFKNGWNFEYPLDDVYIHLAIAEQIAVGRYGVNFDEFASAGSSPLYPILLSPFAESDIQRWLPLVWNIVFLLTSAVLIGCILAKVLPGRTGILLAVLAPIGLNLHVVGYTGMENLGHGAASLMIIFGLWRFVEDKSISILLIFGIFLAPAFRLEGLALAIAAGGTIVLLGRLKTGFGLIILALLPIVGFVGFLTSLGLEPLPNSVMAKLADTGGSGSLTSAVQRLQRNVATEGGRLLFILVLALGLFAAMVRKQNQAAAVFGLAVFASGMAHLIFGAVGWMDRYENYIFISVAAALFLLAPKILPNLGSLAVLAVIAAGVLTYTPNFFSVYIWNPRAISQQQGEMARFAKSFLKEPVAVNDLGYVSWRNDNYVLDLYGLASHEALALRSSNPEPGWAENLASKRDVKFAMIYDPWVGDALPRDWIVLGILEINVPNAFLGGGRVTFYAAEESEAARVLPLLRKWSEDIPSGSKFHFAQGDV